jgi:hypothetical protein
MTVEKILDINTVHQFRAGFELVEYEDGTDPLNGFCLLGFDEIGQFCREPKYAWIAL